jgi:hypothetical protein
MSRLVLALCLWGLGGCGRQEDDASRVAWGHFKELDRGFSSAEFLFGIAADERLNVCFGPLARGVDPDWLRAEVFSAVNLWAMSIGRAIPVDFNDCPRSPALRVVFAAAPVRGSFIGYTDYLDGERRIFLSPDYDWEDIGTTLRFANLPDLARGDWRKKAAFLLPILEQGDYAPLELRAAGVSGKLRQATFATTLHELGHGFGLCDLYTGTSAELGFNENCSQTARADHLGEDEIMTAGTRPGTARFRLSPDDRTGLQRLAARPGFPNRGWPRAVRPLGSADVLARTIAATPAEEGSGADAVRLEGPVERRPLPESGMVAVRLRLRAPLATEAVFVWEERGRGPFVQLPAGDARIERGERVWDFTLELPTPSVYEYRAAVGGQTATGPAVLRIQL